MLQKARVLCWNHKLLSVRQLTIILKIGRKILDVLTVVVISSVMNYECLAIVSNDLYTFFEVHPLRNRRRSGSCGFSALAHAPFSLEVLCWCPRRVLDILSPSLRRSIILSRNFCRSRIPRRLQVFKNVPAKTHQHRLAPDIEMEPVGRLGVWRLSVDWLVDLSQDRWRRCGGLDRSGGFSSFRRLLRFGNEAEVIRNCV